MQNYRRSSSGGYKSNGNRSSSPNRSRSYGSSSFNRSRNSSRSFGGQRSNGGGRRFGGGRGRARALDPRMFVKKAENIEVNAYIPTHKFVDFELSKTVQKNVIARGFEYPTAIQDQSISPILEGRDLVGVADTGTGKTAAFLLPLITKISNDRFQKVLIITPTRELAAQIQDELKMFSLGIGIHSTLCIGGASLSMQSRQLSRRPQFVIGTPGRIQDLQERRRLNLADYQNVVLDEVDRMLDMGFINDIKKIIAFLPQKRQSLFFSATLPESTKVIMQAFLNNHVTVSVKTSATSQNVDQDVVNLRGRNKLEVLHDMLNLEEFKKVLIFGRTKFGVNKLERELRDRGFAVESIHGNRSQAQRTRALDKLKKDNVKILLATDVVSRGIDIDDITHVINFDPPETYEDYIHRIGRTGRAGKKGVALTFVN